MHHRQSNFVKLGSALLILFFNLQVGLAQTNEITYQGKLTENSLPANANYDFEFRLYDAPTAGTLLSTRTRLAVVVTNGIFARRRESDLPS